jgi:hypothetical protein
VDPETQEHALFKGIIDHQWRGQDTFGAGISTKGWEVYVEWMDGATTWLPLVGYQYPK